MITKDNSVSDVPKRRGAGESEEHWLENLDLERSVPASPEAEELDEFDEDAEFIEEEEEPGDEDDEIR